MHTHARTNVRYCTRAFDLCFFMLRTWHSRHCAPYLAPAMRRAPQARQTLSRCLSRALSQSSFVEGWRCQAGSKQAATAQLVARRSFSPRGSMEGGGGTAPLRMASGVAHSP